MNTVELVMEWCGKNQSEWAGRRVSAVPTVWDSDDEHGVRIDLDTENQTARMTIWAVGFFDFEILVVATGKLVLWKHYEFKSSDELIQVLNGCMADFYSAEDDLAL